MIVCFTTEYLNQQNCIVRSFLKRFSVTNYTIEEQEVIAIIILTQSRKITVSYCTSLVYVRYFIFISFVIPRFIDSPIQGTCHGDDQFYLISLGDRTQNNDNVKSKIDLDMVKLFTSTVIAFMKTG